MNSVDDIKELVKLKQNMELMWKNFRKSVLSNEQKDYDEAFMSRYNDIFVVNNGRAYNTITIGELKNKYKLGRGAIIENSEIIDHERFIPKKKFIKNYNRFSPPGKEYLYLAIGNKKDIVECSKAECRVKTGDNFCFCNFDLDDLYDRFELVDLTIADELTYGVLHRRLNKFDYKIRKKGFKIARRLGYPLFDDSEKESISEFITRWSVCIYSKLISEEIFKPICEDTNKRNAYAPFHCLSDYYISLGYKGIIYKSTVSKFGKNLVLFDKKIAKPVGEIEEHIIK